ncbi:Hypothetical predicted protein, partial [Mytilus galloprovincialis]
MHGPDWLTDEKQWPNEFQIDNKVMTTTSRDNETQETQDDFIRTKNNVLNVINVDRYHSFNKTVRILGYVQKFLNNCRNTVPNTSRLTTTYLTPNDIHNATMKLIEAVQHQRYSDVFESLCSKSTHSLIRQLRLYLDKDGLIRCGGRINNAPLPENAKIP